MTGTMFAKYSLHFNIFCCARNKKPSEKPPPKLNLKLPAPRPPQSSTGSLPRSPTRDEKPSSPGSRPPKPAPPRPLSGTTPYPEGYSPTSLVRPSYPGSTALKPAPPIPPSVGVKKPILPPPKPPGGQQARSGNPPPRGGSIPRSPDQQSPTAPQPIKFAFRPPSSPTSGQPIPAPLGLRPATDVATKPRLALRPPAKRMAPQPPRRPSDRDESES